MAILSINSYAKLNTDTFELFAKGTIGQVVGLYLDKVLLRLPKRKGGIIDYWFDSKYLDKI